MKKEGCFTAQRYVKKKSKKSCDCLYVSFAELCRISPVYSDSDRLLYGAERKEWDSANPMKFVGLENFELSV